MKWDVVGIPAFNTYTEDLTESTGMQTIMSLHPDQFRNPWVIPKPQDEVNVLPK